MWQISDFIKSSHKQIIHSTVILPCSMPDCQIYQVWLTRHTELNFFQVSIFYSIFPSHSLRTTKLKSQKAALPAVTQSEGWVYGINTLPLESSWWIRANLQWIVFGTTVCRWHRSGGILTAAADDLMSETGGSFIKSDGHWVAVIFLWWQCWSKESELEIWRQSDSLAVYLVYRIYLMNVFVFLNLKAY